MPKRFLYTFICIQAWHVKPSSGKNVKSSATLQTRVLLYTIAITSTSHLRNVSVRRDTGIVFGFETQQETTKYYPINI